MAHGHVETVSVVYHVSTSSDTNKIRLSGGCRGSYRSQMDACHPIRSMAGAEHAV